MLHLCDIHFCKVLHAQFSNGDRFLLLLFLHEYCDRRKEGRKEGNHASAKNKQQKERFDRKHETQQKDTQEAYTHVCAGVTILESS